MVLRLIQDGDEFWSVPGDSQMSYFRPGDSQMSYFRFGDSEYKILDISGQGRERDRSSGQGKRNEGREVGPVLSRSPSYSRTRRSETQVTKKIVGHDGDPTPLGPTKTYRGHEVGVMVSDADVHLILNKLPSPVQK